MTIADVGRVQSALVSEVERQTSDQWPVFLDNAAPLGLVDDNIDFGELARAAITAMRAADPSTAEKLELAKEALAYVRNVVATTNRFDPEQCDQATGLIDNALAKIDGSEQGLCKHGHTDPTSLCNQCEAQQIDGSEQGCPDCGGLHDPDIRCPNHHAGMSPSSKEGDRG
jgi:hypothetical protein